jgi:hypothetical protein
MKAVLRILDSRNYGPVGRLMFGIGAGVISVLGMWLISTLQHAQKIGMGLTWQWAVTWIMIMGVSILISGGWHERPRAPTPTTRYNADLRSTTWRG